jgi:hypothetical protein
VGQQFLPLLFSRMLTGSFPSCVRSFLRELPDDLLLRPIPSSGSAFAPLTLSLQI